jgi:hypothetical protein
MRLRDLVTAAEEGGQFPPIKVLAGGALFIGHLGTREQQRERAHWGLAEELFNAERPRRQADAEALFPEVSTQATGLLDRVDGNHPAPDVFCLLNCQVWPASGDGVEVAAVHIAHEAVDGWWLGAQKRLTRKGSGGLFVGALVPLDLSG